MISKPTKIIIEERTGGEFLVYLPHANVCGVGATLEKAKDNFINFFILTADAYGLDTLLSELDDVEDVYISVIDIPIEIK